MVPGGKMEEEEGLTEKNSLYWFHWLDWFDWLTAKSRGMNFLLLYERLPSRDNRYQGIPPTMKNS
jgi:hypothetical protein